MITDNLGDCLNQDAAALNLFEELGMTHRVDSEPSAFGGGL